MADICVLYVSNTETQAAELVALLRRDWQVWWAGEIAHGNWEEAVRAEVRKVAVVVPVLAGSISAILKDEMRLAQELRKPILPFIVGPTQIPFGFGDLNRTEAHGWRGENDKLYQQLKKKIATALNTVGTPIIRPRELQLARKTLSLPSCALSLSSHETQVRPDEGAALLRLLEPPTVLVSSYDARGRTRAARDLIANAASFRDSRTTLFVDSGNYEAYRKSNRYSKSNPSGWRVEDFHRVLASLSPDLALTFDTLVDTPDPERIARAAIRSYRRDERALRERDFPLCPIVHLPAVDSEELGYIAGAALAEVARDLAPVIVAVPERELGDGLLSRFRAVRQIRTALDSLGRYYPLHLLGTGNPISTVALAVAGADVFDGLEWCRTIADYDTGFLFHFQQFELFSVNYRGRIRSEAARQIIDGEENSYALRALSYNVDFYCEWERTMQNLIHSGQSEALLRVIPNLGPALYKELQE